MSLFPNEPRFSIDRDYAIEMGVTKTYKFLRDSGMPPSYCAKFIVETFFDFEWIKLWDGFELNGYYLHFDEDFFGNRLTIGDFGDMDTELRYKDVRKTIYHWKERDVFDAATATRIGKAIVTALRQIGEYEISVALKKSQQ